MTGTSMRHLRLSAALAGALLMMAPGYAFAERDHGEHGGNDQGDRGGTDTGGGDHGGTGSVDHGGSDAGGGDHGSANNGGSDHGGTDTAGSDHGGGTDSGGSGDRGSTDIGGGDHGSTDTGGGTDSGSGDRGGSGSGSGDRGGTDSGSGDHGGSDSGSGDHGGSDESGDHGGSDSGGSSGGTSGSDGGSSGDGDKPGGGSDDSAPPQEPLDNSTAHAAHRGDIDLARDRDGREYRAHELVVIGGDNALDILAARGYDVRDRHALTADSGAVARVVLPAAVDPAVALADLERTPGLTADLNGVYRLAGTATVGLKRTAPVEIGRYKGAVGVIDSGVDRASLGPALSEERSFAAGHPFVGAHGTLVATIASAEGARIYSANVFVSDQSGQAAASADTLAAAIDWLVSEHVPVINLSLAGPPNAVLARELVLAQSKGVLIVAAAGNDGPAAPPDYPAAYNEVIAVTAIDGANNVYRYANRGSYIMFAARGVDVDTHRGPPESPRVSGTSYAAPVVAGRLAARAGSSDPTALRAALMELRTKAKDLGAPGRDPVFGFGLIPEK